MYTTCVFGATAQSIALLMVAMTFLQFFVLSFWMSKITKSILFILISPDELSFFSALVYIPIVDIRMAPSKNVWKIWEEQQISEQGTTG